MKIFSFIVSLFIVMSCFSFVSFSVRNSSSEIPLPPPLSVDMTYRDAIMSRCSVRSFIVSPEMKSIGDEELSTILWAAYGYRGDGSRTVQGIDGLHSSIIYVFREEAVYTYNPLNHSLVFYREGDLRNTVNWQHRAPVQLGIVWDRTRNSDENFSSVEIGEIAQNIYFIANALGLGTVTAGMTGFDSIDLPENQIGRIVMPIGYPQKSPIFEYNPNLHSFLPNVMDSNASLINVIEDRREESTFNGAINLQELSQLVWASYGFSYLIDITDSSTNEVERHRTVPSSHCTYPLVLYVVTKSGIFRYFPHVIRLNPYSDSPLYSVNWQFPVISFLLPIRLGDYRDEIAESCSQKSIASSPMIIIPILPLSSLYKVPWPWYYEAGASAYNVMLESEILDLHASIVRPTDSSLIKVTLRIPYDSLPLLVIPIGR